MGLRIYNSRICINGLIPTFYGNGNAKGKRVDNLDDLAPGKLIANDCE